MTFKFQNLFPVLFLAVLITCCKEDKSQSNNLPSQFIADRIFVEPVTQNGIKLSLFTDTGGGANMLFPGTIKKLGLKIESLNAGKSTTSVVPFPKFKPGYTIPIPANKPPFGEKVFVPEESEVGEQESDGVLGRTWFAEKIWQFDYPGETISVLDSYKPSESEKKHLVPLGFQKDPSGNKTTFFPRLSFVVDGDTLNMLYDSGATATLKDSAHTYINDGLPKQRATSFIVETVFNKWKEKHPDWKVIENADNILSMPMIKVPEITVAGYNVGPVWFTMRPDNNFYNFMSKWMDRKIDGALGGSAFHYFKIILNYPEEYAVFIK